LVRTRVKNSPSAATTANGSYSIKRTVTAVFSRFQIFNGFFRAAACANNDRVVHSTRQRHSGADNITTSAATAAHQDIYSAIKRIRATTAASDD
jgi:hypothetical protein